MARHAVAAQSSGSPGHPRLNDAGYKEAKDPVDRTDVQTEIVGPR